MIKSCMNCKFLSKNGDHLIPYLKEQHKKEPEFYTCKFPHKFRRTWLFGIGKIEPGCHASNCGSVDFQPKIEFVQLKLF